MSVRFRSRRVGQTGLRSFRAAHAVGLGLGFALLASSACGPLFAETEPAARPGSLDTAEAGVPQGRAGTLSFRVAGTAIGPGTRQAELIVLNGTGLDGQVYSVTEGSLVQGYRVAKITRDEVTLEMQGAKDGEPLHVPVNNPVATPAPSLPGEAAVASSAPSGQAEESASAAAVEETRQGSRVAVTSTAPSSRPVSADVSDPSQLPPEIRTAVRAQAQTFLQELSQNQTFRNKLEEVRSQLIMRAGAMKR